MVGIDILAMTTVFFALKEWNHLIAPWIYIRSLLLLSLDGCYLMKFRLDYCCWSNLNHLRRIFSA